jgi:hypothetical protein
MSLPIMACGCNWKFHFQTKTSAHRLFNLGVIVFASLQLQPVQFHTAGNSVDCLQWFQLNDSVETQIVDAQAPTSSN